MFNIINMDIFKVCVWVTVFTQVPELILFISFLFFFSMLMYWR